MWTILVFSFERAIVNLFPILIGIGIVAWLAGGRMKRSSFGPTARSLIYALAGTLAGLISYWSYDLSRDGNMTFAVILVGLAMFILAFFLAFITTYLVSRKRSVA